MLKQSKSVQHLSSINVRDEWATPKNRFDYVVENYNVTPLLDVCATFLNRKCALFHSKKDSALEKNWVHTWWMNPPYSEISTWMKYAYEQHLKHNVTGVALIYSKTDTRYWHDYVEGKAEVHFIKGRIKFLDEFGKQSKNSAPYPSCYVIWRSK